MYTHADLALFNSHGQLIAIVEIKSKIGTSRKWATLTRRNIVAHGNIGDAPYFLLVTPDRLYIWKEAGADPTPIEPTHEADTTAELAPYFLSSGVNPAGVSGHAFELIVGAWFGDVMRSDRRSEESTDALHWLVKSGLSAAVQDGRVEYEAVV